MMKNKELFHESISDSWELVINKKETKKRLQVVFDKLLANTTLKNVSFLEVGCGLGYFSQEAKKRGAKVTGIDIGKKLIARCRKEIPGGRFIVASADKLPFANNSFDIVLCTEVIEHVNKPLKTISEIKRVVKPGGVIVLTTPNKLFRPFFLLLSFLRIRPYRGNENWFYQAKLVSIFNEMGLVILKKHHFNFFYPVPLFDFFEQFSLLGNFMINQGYVLRK